MTDYQHIEILLVEDMETDADLTMRSLKKNNFLNKLHWVKDGQEALDFLYCKQAYTDRDSTEKPLLILLDIKMPKVDGIAVLKQIKADPQMRDIPVIVMTSSNEQKDVDESYQLGVNGYVVKPLDFSAYTEAVSHIGLYWMMTNRSPIAAATR